MAATAAVAEHKEERDVRPVVLARKRGAPAEARQNPKRHTPNTTLGLEGSAGVEVQGAGSKRFAAPSALPDLPAAASRRRKPSYNVEEGKAEDVERDANGDVEMIAFDPHSRPPALDMEEEGMEPMGWQEDTGAIDEAAWITPTGSSPPYTIPLLNFRLSKRDMRMGQEICTLLIPCDIPAAEMPPDGRPVDARCLRPGGWLSSCVIDRLLEKFVTWADGPTGLLGVVSSAESYALYLHLQEHPLGPWPRQCPAQRRLQGYITQHQITLLPVCVGGHWATFIFENRGTTGVVHIYNSINTYGRSVLYRLARLATRHYAGAGGFPVTWAIQHEACPQQENSYDCGLFALAVSMEIGGRFVSGYGPPPILQIPDLRHLRIRLAILLTESLADWTHRVGPSCF
jgi:hypothetical protein